MQLSNGSHHQVCSFPPRAVIPTSGDRYVSPPASPTRIAGRNSSNSPSRTGTRVWGWRTPLSRKGSLSISRAMRQGCNVNSKFCRDNSKGLVPPVKHEIFAKNIVTELNSKHSLSRFILEGTPHRFQKYTHSRRAFAALDENNESSGPEQRPLRKSGTTLLTILSSRKKLPESPCLTNFSFAVVKVAGCAPCASSRRTLPPASSAKFAKHLTQASARDVLTAGGSMKPIARPPSAGTPRCSSPHSGQEIYAPSIVPPRLYYIASIYAVGRKDSEVQQQCINCTFANPELSVECQMCGEPLPYGRARRKVRVRTFVTVYGSFRGWRGFGSTLRVVMGGTKSENRKKRSGGSSITKFGIYFVYFCFQDIRIYVEP